MRAAWLLPLVLGLVGCGHEAPAAPEAEPSVVGVWILDAEAYRASYVKLVESEIDANVRRGTLPPDEADLVRTQLLQEMHDRFSTMWWRFTFYDDKTFRSEGSDGTRAGRWGFRGTRVELTVTEEKGAPLEEPALWPGTVEHGVMTLRPEADKDYVITLRAEP